MSTNLLQSHQILTKFIIETVGKELRVLAIHNILLSIEEPFGDFVLSGVLQDCDDSLKFFRRELAGTKKTPESVLSQKSTVVSEWRGGWITNGVSVPLVEVNVGLFDDDV